MGTLEGRGISCCIAIRPASRLTESDAFRTWSRREQILGLMICA